MRILHTSDWHIGRTFHGYTTIDALRGVLGEMASIVREEAIDLVIVAGDVFDSAAPAPECYTVLTDALVGLREAGAQVIVTSGNHDSAARLGFQARLLRDGIHVLTDPTRLAAPITVVDAHGPVHVYGIPYLAPAQVRHLWPEAELRTQAQTLQHAMDLVRADRAERGGRSVVVSHCFAAGIEATPGLEREIRQGSLDVVPLAVFDGPDYVALGHIHGRQQLSDRVRYAGAPLHYGFGEKGRRRGVWIVDLDEAGLASVAWRNVSVPRRLEVLRAPLDDLLTDPRFADAESAWVSAEYTDALPQRDVMRRLQQRFPFCANVAHVPDRADAGVLASYAQRVRQARSDRELIDAFLGHVREGEAASPAEAELLRTTLAEKQDALVEAGA
ncbi:exonuclease SbcCD subunit D [Microbacterium sp. SORGH_AS_0862]|uniref:exonuclease SbcCD subunit D n=1 Tax=Microbacterium sp. SORGH_AS_0862 TaxID=3041789 RepID=UPI002792501A|nr:exonuclease SbcCD subunit D [Microbacterium sp. SORGH_AS_0862]MDQ1205765.1 exonuclease SbcD [Microbacterium sp. SORGH_AS_0862]